MSESGCADSNPFLISLCIITVRQSPSALAGKKALRLAVGDTAPSSISLRVRAKPSAFEGSQIVFLQRTLNTPLRLPTDARVLITWVDVQIF